MTILHKLETSYLAILRFVVILISGLLLVATLYLSLSALVNMRDGSKLGVIISKVAPDQIVTEITRAQPNPNVSPAKPAAKTLQSPVDPNRADYERATSIIVSFINKYGRGEEVSNEGVISAVKSRIEIMPTPELVKASAAGLPDVLERVFSDKKVIELARRSTWSDSSEDLFQHDLTVGRSPIWLVNMALEHYLAGFSEQVSQSMEKEEAEKEGEIIRKQNAMQSLYMAGGTFGTFLLLALLAIIVRIERNLRPLVYLAEKAKEEK